MRHYALSTVASLALLTTSLAAQAADLPRKAPPVVYAPVFTWTGFYIGLNAGGIRADGDVSSNFGAGWGATGTSFILGGQAGYNWQMGNFVLGIEGDFDWTNAHRSSGFVTTVPFGSVQATADWDWVATIAARFGYAWDRVLLYGKIGAGWSKTSVAVVTAGGATVASSNNTNTGLLLGLGLEYAFSLNWTAKVEFNWLDMGDRTFNNGVNSFTVSPNIQMVKFGVNYKF